MEKLVVTFAVAFIAVVVATESDDSIIENINRAQNMWKAGKNEITDKGIEYMKRLLGTKIPENLDILPRRADIEIEENIPTSFDARTQWPHCTSIGSIKNQGHCGSCWAVAAASAASDRVCISSGFKVVVNISAENLLACCSDCTDPGERGCDGGYPEKAWNYFKKIGIVTGGDYDSAEGCQPYEIAPSDEEVSENEENYYTPPCQKKCTNKKYPVSFRKDKHYGRTSYLLKQSETTIQSDILKYGPVEAAFTVYYDFYYYTSGIYKQTSTFKVGGHAVRVIGWGVENGVKYWTVANSWGKSWGENGTFRIRRGTNECGFEEYVTAGLIKK
ncbi:cathepsin B-like cysteine proteinase 4 [Lycorma delicatula]|uniref:cathepsin B-like cysteine proteinase 4 n=1 Tax=Lycorma delicatula TaxID=130591 RepID=UPI003F50DADC